MKIFAPIVAAFILSACSPTQPEQELLQEPSFQSQNPHTGFHFIEICSGIEMKTEAEGMLAVSNCLGRIRGYADGVALHAELHHTPKLWCIDTAKTDQDVMNAVLTWVDNNTERYAVYVQSLDSRTAASATIIQGLRESFICRST